MHDERRATATLNAIETETEIVIISATSETVETVEMLEIVGRRVTIVIVVIRFEIELIETTPVSSGDRRRTKIIRRDGHRLQHLRHINLVHSYNSSNSNSNNHNNSCHHKYRLSQTSCHRINNNNIFINSSNSSNNTHSSDISNHHNL